MADIERRLDGSRRRSTAPRPAPPRRLVRFDRASVIQRAERRHGVVLRVSEGVRPLLHEALIAGTADVDAFCSALPRAYAEALREVRADDAGIETWVAIASRWMN